MQLSRTALGIVLFAVVNGLIAQSLESYTAHGLVDVAGDYGPTLYHMSAKYHMWHVLTLFFIAMMYDRIGSGLAHKLLIATVGFIMLGTLMFCGAMYGQPFGASVYVAAIGAIVLIIGWVFFAAAIIAALVQTES